MHYLINDFINAKLTLPQPSPVQNIAFLLAYYRGNIILFKKKKLKTQFRHAGMKSAFLIP